MTDAPNSRRSISLRRVPGRIAERGLGAFFDWRANVRTGARGKPTHHGRFADAMGIRSTSMLTLVSARRLMEQLKKEEGLRAHAMVDIGCSVGRAVCYWARTGLFSRVTGIEVDRELADQARNNIQRLRGRQSDVEILEMDVLDYQFSSDQDVIFMFNPFGAKTFAAMLERLMAVGEPGRPLYIIYVNPQQEALIRDTGRVRREWSGDSSNVPGGRGFRVFEVIR